MLILTNVDSLIVAYPFVAVMTDVDLLIPDYLLTAIITNKHPMVVLDMHVLVFLGMNEHLFLPQLILKTQLIETAALMAAALDGHACLVFWQFIRRQVGFAVGAAGGDGLVGVAVEVADDQFLADAGNRHRPP
ncbi:hypothetical protein D3C75_1116790 [compost metagenome]